jgi:hypothetical protein
MSIEWVWYARWRDRTGMASVAGWTMAGICAGGFTRSSAASKMSQMPSTARKTAGSHDQKQAATRVG